MLSQAIEYQHEGKVELDWRKEGLICRVTLPIAKAASPSASRQEEAQGGPRPKRSVSKRRGDQVRGTGSGRLRVRSYVSRMLVDPR